MAGKDFSTTMNDDNKCTKKNAFLHKSILSEDGTFKLIFITSLEDIAMIKVVSSLWMTQSILQKILNCNSTQEPDFSWIEKFVASKIFELPIAKSIAEKLTEAVPFIGYQILNFIRYHNGYIFNRLYSEDFPVHLVNSIQWTARGKIDYPQTAKSILANPNCCLTDDQKYKLACACCLEDEIAHLSPEVLHPTYLDYVTLEFYPMVHFWTAKITNDALYPFQFDIYCQHNKNSSFIEFIMKLLIQKTRHGYTHFNDVPIMYLWNKFSEKEKARNIISVVTTLCNLDLKFSVLLNFSYEQQREILKTCYQCILESILVDQLFGQNFLPVLFHILDVIEPENYSDILDYILTRMFLFLQGKENKYKYDHHSSIFKHLWLKSSKHLKDFIFNLRGQSILQRYVIFMLSWNRDMDIIKLIFNDLYAQGKKYMPLGPFSIKYCSYLMLSDQWELLELFIKYALFYEKYVSQLNQEHIKKREPEIDDYFLEALNKKNYYFNVEYGKEKQQVKEFRKSSAYLRCQTIFESVIIETEVNFKVLENHLEWCFDEYYRSKKWFQKYFPELYCWILVICKLVEEDRYELLYHKIKVCKC